MINNKQATPPFRELVGMIKQLYDNEGPEAVAKSIGHAFKQLITDKQKERMAIMVEIFYKMDTCISNCFDDIELKATCVCACNDEDMTINLDYDIPKA